MSSVQQKFNMVPENNITSPLSPSPTLNADEGYIKLSFPGKKEQLVEVSDYIRQQKMIPDDIVQEEVSWFYK